jgi:O-antigen ligase
MNRLWLFFFPLLFIPNIGLSHQTAFGTLEVSDWLIVPFIILLLIAPSAKYEQHSRRFNPLLWGFLGWALLSTLSIHFRYQYISDIPVLVGCGLKLARLVLYTLASLLIARKLSDPRVRTEWLWSLLIALLVLSVGLLASKGDASAQPTDALGGYKSYNIIIVSQAILCTYIAGWWIDSGGSRRWNLSAVLVVGFAICSVLLSSSLTTHGRGGWVAFIAGFGYIFVKKTQNLKIVIMIVVIGSASILAYEALPTFKSLVDLTLLPTETSGSQSVDDGGRIATWAHELPKLINSPLLGTGFYHRGDTSGLWETGSHNFFIQMFLETGIVGGVLVISIFAIAWQQAGFSIVVRNKIGVATRASLVTAIAGGMSGEYYYGGIGVLVLLAVLAVAGSLPVSRVVAPETDPARSIPAKWQTIQ